MMKGWKEVKLGEITDLIKRGVAPKYVEKGGYIVINQKCIRDGVLSFESSRLTSKEKRISDEKFIQIGDVLINSTGTGTLGRTAPVRKLLDKTTVDTHVTIFRGNDSVHKLFLGYLLKYHEPLITLLGKGATNQIELGASDLKVSKVKIPKSKETQRKIASILSAYDDLIENNLKRIALNCDLAETKFMSLFLNKENWVKTELKEVAKYFGRGVTPKYEEGTGFYGINQKANKGLTLNKSVFKEFKKGDWIPKEKYATKGDLIINSLGEGTIGRVHYYMGMNNKYPIDQHMSIFRANDLEVGLFVFQFFNSKYGQGHLHTLKKGGTNMTMLNIGDLRKIKIDIPPKKVLKNYYYSVINLFKSKAILEEQNQHLKEARDILLPRLMSGLIDVDSLEFGEVLGMVAEENANYNKG